MINYEMYKKAKKEVKKIINDGKPKAHDDLYNKTGTRKGEKIFSSLQK